jgi:hypothetical protein
MVPNQLQTLFNIGRNEMIITHGSCGELDKDQGLSSQSLFQDTRRTAVSQENLIQDSWCHGQDSNHVPPENKSDTFH